MDADLKKIMGIYRLFLKSQNKSEEEVPFNVFMQAAVEFSGIEDFNPLLTSAAHKEDVNIH